jgi:hypothetical protein
MTDPQGKIRLEYWARWVRGVNKGVGFLTPVQDSA